MPDVGDTLTGRYRLLGLLGRGGMADVYRAWDSDRSAEVAVKVLREDYAEEPEFTKRFSREAQALARLDHPNIVRFYSFEQDGTTAFIVMDCVRGSTLRKRLRDAGGPLPLDEVTRVLREVGAALNFAHRRGYLHRDVKPANIIIDEHGRALLSDFGIARAAEATTTAHAGAGTPAYMSPEQILGQPLDAGTDIYSLGVVLYEMVAGRRPYLGESGTGATTPDRVRDEHLRASPPDPRQFCPGLPADIAGIILRALAKDPGERWPDVSSLVAAWDPTRHQERPVGSTVSMPPPRAQAANRAERVPAPAPGLPNAAAPRQPQRSPRGARPARRPRRPIAAAAVAVLAVAAIGVAATVVALARGPRATPVSTAVAVSPEPPAAARGDVEGTVILAAGLYLRDGPLGDAEATAVLPFGTTFVVVGWTQKETGQCGSGIWLNVVLEGSASGWVCADSRFVRVAERPVSPELLDELGVPTASVATEPLATAAPEAATTAEPSPTPQPSATPRPVALGRIAFTSDRDGNGEIYVMNADGGDLTNLSNNDGNDGSPVWSPDGSRIAYYSTRDGNHEIYAMNADGSGQIRLTDDPASDVFPKWSPDGSRIAFTSDRDGNYEIYVMNADGSGQTNLTNSPGLDAVPDWSPDGGHIAFTCDRDGSFGICVMSADGSGQNHLISSAGHDWVGAWSPDGSDIAFSSDRTGDYEIYVMSADGSDQTRLTDYPGVDWSPVWSPDGSLIAFSSDRAGNYEIYITSADGSGQTNVTNNPGSDQEPAWSPR